MLLIKNDPKYNEQWPRALVPYKRIYGIDEPKRLAPLANDGSLSPLSAGGDAVRPGRRIEPVQARELPGRRRAQGRGDGDVRWRPRPHRRLPRPGPVQHGRERRLAQLVQPGGRGRPLYQRRHSRRPHPGPGADDRPQPRPEVRPAVSQPRQRTDAHPRRNPRAQVRRRQAAARPRRQSRHELPGEDPGRRAVHVPDAGQGRHGAEHGPDVASAAAGRDPQRLRRLPRPQPEADAVRQDRRGPGEL